MSFIKNWYLRLTSKLPFFLRYNENFASIVSALKIKPLFSGLTEKQLCLLTKYVKLVTLSTTERIQDNLEVKNDKLYILLSGHVQATTRPKTDLPFGKLSEYGAGDIINLMRITDPEFTTEINGIIEPTTCFVIELSALSQEPMYKKIHPILLNNMAQHFHDRLNHVEQVLVNTNTIAMKSIAGQLEEAKTRVLFGMFVVRMISILCVYTLSLRSIEIIEIGFGDPSIISGALMLIVSYFVYNAMMRTQLPLTEFGITIVDWKQSVIEGVAIALALFLAMLLIKLFAISSFPQFSSVPLFEFDTGFNKEIQVIDPKKVFVLIIYIIFSPVQEFLVRGGLQGSLYCFLSGTQRQRNWVSIIVSNLIFITFHSHISILFALTALIPGIAWGWLYSRHKTLIGVTVSHLVLGFLGIFMLGITSIVGTTGT